MIRRAIRSFAIALPGLLLLLATASEANHPNPLPDTITTPNLSYTIHFTNNNPYTPPAGAGDDTNFVPTAVAQSIADAADTSNPFAVGNPNGYDAGYTALGFLGPDFDGAPHQVFVFDCNMHGGCDTADAGPDRIQFLAPSFVGASDACARLVLGHELFHHVQYAYFDFDNWPAWGTMLVEGTARMMQDKIYTDLDADAGCITYRGEVNGYLANPNRAIWDISYTSALFWNYMTEQYGAVSAEPNVGSDFIRGILEYTQTHDADIVQDVRSTIAAADNTQTLENTFHDFAITNATKDLDLTLIPDALRYRYVDENGPTGTAMDEVVRTWEGNVPPQRGPVADSVSRWGARYYEAHFGAPGTNECAGVAGFLSDGDSAAYGLVTIKGPDAAQTIHRGVTGHFAKSFLQRRTDPFTRMIAVVAGLADSANYDYTFACGPVTLDIKDPTGPPDAHEAFVGNFDAPERFLIRVVVSGPAALGTPSVEGLSATDFDVFVGPAADPANQATVLSGARVQGEYWLVAQAPIKPANGTFDLTVSLRDLASDTEPLSVRYEVRILDQVLVVDRSGSMLDPAGSPKIDAAKNAATLYVDSVGSQDRIGSVSFSGNGSEPNDDATLDRILANASAAQRTNTKNAITAIAAGGATSIGDGLDKGRTEFAIRGNPLGEDWLVLLSDGMQNEAQSWNDVKPAVLGAGIRVNTIALGPITDQALLQQIATDTGGIYYYVDVGTAAANGPLGPRAAAPSSGPLPNRLSDAYSIAAEHMNRDERLWEETGSVASSQGFDIPIAEGGIEDARFVFNWSSPADRLGVEITRPDSSVVTDGVLGARIFTSPTHQVFHVGNLGPGTWHVELSAVTGAPSYLGVLSGRNRQGASLDFWFGEYHGDTTIKAQNGLFLRGLPMPIVATLTDRNGPVGGATVEATIEHPDGSLILLPLLDDGGHGDADAGDGIYGNFYTRTTAFSLSNQADDPSTAQRGSYPVRVEASGIDSVSQPFARIRKAAFQVFEGRSEQGLPPDTDNDGMPNRYEVLHECLKQFSDDGSDDGDEDGLKNRDEYEMGTDPCHPDTDRGGESDLSEFARGANVFDLRDDKLPRPMDASVIDKLPDHQPGLVLPPHGNLIRFPVNAAYAQIRLLRSPSPTGPFAPIATFPAAPSGGLYVDGGLPDGVPFYYKVVALDLNGNQSAPSHVFSGTPSADPTPPLGRITIDGDAPFTTSLNVGLALDADPDTVEMRLSNDPLFAGAPWVPFAASSPWIIAPDPITNTALVYVQYRDGSSNESSVYSDEIEVVPPGSFATLKGQVLLGGEAVHDASVIAVTEGDTDVGPAFTDAGGFFGIPFLAPGTYSLRLEHTGFATQSLAGILVPAAGIDIGTFTLTPIDTDGDGIADNHDNCVEEPNPNQRDTNADGYGNVCDMDVDGNGIVGISDFNALRAAFGKTCPDVGFNADVDANGDCVIGLPDFNELRSSFGEPPGPSGLSCAGTAPCP